MSEVNIHKPFDPKLETWQDGSYIIYTGYHPGNADMTKLGQIYLKLYQQDGSYEDITYTLTEKRSWKEYVFSPKVPKSTFRKLINCTFYWGSAIVIGLILQYYIRHFLRW